MTSAVFDCVVFLQAAANPNGAAGACLAFVESRNVSLFVSRAILDEARDVFSRPNIRSKFPKLTEEIVDGFLFKLATLATFIHDVPAAMHLSRDPTDEPYLNLAIACKAGFIVSRDNDLLDLMKDEEFRKAYPHLTITDPVAFLKHVCAVIGNPV